MYLSKNIYSSSELKPLLENSFHLFLGEESKLITAKQVWLESNLGISLSQKFVTLSTIRSYFGFQNFFYVDRLANKFFLSIRADFISK